MKVVRPVFRVALGPVLRRILARAADQTAAAVAPLQAKVEGIELQLDRAIPVLLNRISSQAAADRGYARSIADLYERIEFVRNEVLYELRYASGRRGSEGGIAPKVLNHHKLERMGTELRVNLGAGHLARDEYLNVDVRALEGIDIVAGVEDLPFEPGSLAEIFSSHLLEHFPIEELRRVLLPYWVSLLRQGGRFVAIVPDLETMIVECAAGRLSFEDFRQVAYGSQEYEGDFHFNGFSPDLLTSLFMEAGLTEVCVRASGRRNGMCYEMEVEGVRPRAPELPADRSVGLLDARADPTR